MPNTSKSSRKAEFFLLSVVSIVAILFYTSSWIQGITIIDSSSAIVNDEYFVFDNAIAKLNETVTFSRNCDDLKYNLEEFKLFLNELGFEKNYRIDADLSLPTCTPFNSPFNNGILTGDLTISSTKVSLKGSFSLPNRNPPTIPAPPFNFYIALSPISSNISSGSSTSTTLSLNLISGTSQPVSFTCLQLPRDVLCSFNPVSCASLPCPSSISITTGSLTPPGDYEIPVVGYTSSGISNQTSYLLSVYSTLDYSVSLSPSSANVTQGSSASSTVNVVLNSGNPESVAFGCSGLPSNTNCIFSPSSCTPTCPPSTLTITTAASTPIGLYTISIDATSSSTSRSASFILNVTA